MRTFFTLTFAVLFVCIPSIIAAQESSGPQHPVTQQEIDQLKRQIDQDTHSSVQTITDYHTESGDLNNRLDFVRYGGLLNLKMNSSTTLRLTGTQTNYLPINDVFREHGTNLTAGLQTKVAESIDAHLEGGVTRFSTDTISVNALASIIYNVSDQTHFYVTANRSNVEESLLSTTGIRPVAGPFAGQLVGRVMENRFLIGGSSRLSGAFDVFGEGGAGNRAGSNVPSNFFRTVGGGVGYSILTRPDDDPLNLLRAAYEFNYFGFDDNRFGFGGASLLSRRRAPIIPARIGTDAISPDPGPVNPGVGGYFSPNNFVGNIVRLEARGGSVTGLNYKVSGFVGAQNYTGAPGHSVEGFSGTVTIGITERVSLPVTYFIDNFGPFTQQSLYVKVVYRF
jgi:hypothetical protein